MRTMAKFTFFCAAMLCTAWALAQQAPAGAPAGTTGLCKDGSYWSGATKRGACHGHKGVKEWYGSSSTAAPAESAGGTASAPASAAPSSAAPSSAAPAAPAAAPKSSSMMRSAPTPAATAAPGGGPGQVWVNHKSKVYHCSGDRWYGKTKDGEYMTEAAATSAGYRPDHGKACK